MNRVRTYLKYMLEKKDLLPGQEEILTEIAQRDILDMEEEMKEGQKQSEELWKLAKQ